MGLAVASDSALRALALRSASRWMQLARRPGQSGALSVVDGGASS